MIPTAPLVVRIDSYELECSARGLDGGKYAPVLIAKKQAWPSRPRLIDVSRGDHDDEASAIQAAHSKGIEWVADFG